MSFTEKIGQAVLDCYEKIKAAICTNEEKHNKDSQNVENASVPLPADAVILADNVYSTSRHSSCLFEGNNLVIGSTGSGKDRNYVYPNLMQMNSNYVIMDMHGECVRKFYHSLRDNGYEIQVFSASGKPVAVETKAGSTEEVPSLFYNPFAYIDTEHSVDHLAKTLTSFLDDDHCDPLYVSLLRFLFCAVIDYVSTLDNTDHRNFYHVKHIISHFLPNKDDTACPEGFLSQLAAFYHDHPDRIGASALYRLTSACETAMLRETLFTAFVILDTLFPSTQLSFLPQTYPDELELDTFRTKKKALFIVLDSKESPDLCSVLLAQMSQVFMSKRDINLQPVHFLLNDFRVLPIFDFESLCSSQVHNMMYSIVVQTISQLGKNLNEIVTNCANILFLGGSDSETIDYLRKRAGITTVYNPHFVLSREDIVLFKIGNPPMECKKYLPESHPKYKELP